MGAPEMNAKEIDQTKEQVNQSQEQKKEEGPSFVEKAKEYAGKAVSVAGTVTSTVTITTAGVILGIMFIDYLAMGPVVGLLVLAAGALALNYLGNGLKHGVWNPIDSIRGALFA